ncbi:MAG: ATP-grasp domain-containing protein [bacterium]|nr:ATP-grasp domain-containing protein [bacterium]
MHEVVTQSVETVGILMPHISDSYLSTFRARYAGLSTELAKSGYLASFDFTHESYDPYTHNFTDQQELDGTPIVSDNAPLVVRNLTMRYWDQPIYGDPSAPRLVHDTDFNRLISRKDKVAELLPDIHPITIIAEAKELEEAMASIPGYRVILKPITGMRSKGVRIIRKKSYQSFPGDGKYLVQEYIDNHRGDKQLGIDGTHNLRIVSINSVVIGAIARVGGVRKSILLNDSYGSVYAPEQLPEELHALTDKVHQGFINLPGGGKNVLAIDTMFGRSKNREDSYVVCEINERPVRVGPVQATNRRNSDTKGILWLGNEWDKAEAKMLASTAKQEVGE